MRGANECWPWTGPLDRDGYGIIGDEQHRQLRAHRIAYERQHGPIPDGKNVCHSCDNPPCVNHAHLFLGTTDENNKDKARKLRAWSKLTADQVKEIRQLYATGQTMQDIAAKFGVTAAGCIWPIVRRKVWQHLL